jgi:hypothetical protein
MILMDRIGSLVNLLQKASSASQRSILSILIEMIRLRYSIGRMGSSEYFVYRLYENDLSFDQKKAFCGYKTQSVLEEILVDDRSKILSIDKVTMYLLLKGYGFPIPELRAIYASGLRKGPFRCIDSAEALCNYLKEPNILPIYVKPSFSERGRGNTLVQSLINNTLELGGGSRVTLEEFCTHLETSGPFGWIFQEPLHAHSAIAKLCGTKISGVRIHTFLSKMGPKITRAIWKINAGKTDFDNFARGTSGNMVAKIDIETGTVIRVVAGMGPAQTINPPHPVTGNELRGFRIPHWKKVIALVLDASAAFKGYLCPGWDIAICEDGPRILEVNYFGDVDIPQYSYRRGFADSEFVGLMRELGLHHLMYGGSRNWQRSRGSRFGRRRAHWKW